MRRTILLLALVLEVALGFPGCGAGGGTAGGGCSPLFVHATRAGGSGGDHIAAVAALPDGALLVAGHFEGTARFGLGAGPERTSAGKADAFLARIGADGNLGWVATFGGDGDDRAAAVAALPDGSALVAGSFQSTLRFGDVVLSPTGGSDGFLARYGADGALVWARRLGGSGSGASTAVAAWPDGTSLVAAVSSPPGEKPRMIAMRHGPDGKLGWSASAAATGGIRAFGLAPLPGGDALVAGEFLGTAAFGAAGTALTLTSAGDADAFVARLRADGTFAWAVRAGGEGGDRALAVATLPDGSAVTAGSFAAPAVFGPGEAAEVILLPSGAEDAFVARYDALGRLTWARRAGGTGRTRACAVAAQADGPFAVSGWFTGAATFGPGEAREATLRSAGGLDAFVARYDAAGRLLWVLQAGGSEDDEAAAVAIRPDWVIAVGGAFAGSATFAPDRSGVATFASYGATDGFLMLVGP